MSRLNFSPPVDKQILSVAHQVSMMLFDVFNRSFSQLVNQSISQSVSHQPVSQLVSQSCGQSFNQYVEHSVSIKIFDHCACQLDYILKGSNKLESELL